MQHQANAKHMECEWYTPSEFVEAARSTLGCIDVDPATSDIAQQTVKAKTYFTKADNGLEQDWIGKVWMNPPYSNTIGKWCEKLCGEISNGHCTEAITLVNNSTETGWFNTLMDDASAMCLVKGRIGFIQPDGTRTTKNSRGQVIFYFGHNASWFEKHFGQFGKVVEL